MEIKDFKCGWRFTDDNYALFSDHELSEMSVMCEYAIKAAWDKVCDADNLMRCSFINKVVSKQLPVLIGDCGWGENEKRTELILKECFQKWGSNAVNIIYDITSGIRVSAALFSEKWSDFCYPSDILLINSEEMFLLYYEDTIYLLSILNCD